MCFTGHSLGGSMAMLLMAWSRLRLGLAAERMEPLHTFGSPPVMAVDGWEMHKRGAERTSRRVGAAAAGGADWVGELMGAVGAVDGGGGGGGGGFAGFGNFGGFGGDGVGGTSGGVDKGALVGDEGGGGGGAAGGGGGGGGGGGTQGVQPSYAQTDIGGGGRGRNGRSTKPGGVEGHENPLVLAGLAPDSVRSFVLSNDPVPRMWLAANPLFGAAAANETVSGLFATREWLFGAGIFSQQRFLYEAVVGLALFTNHVILQPEHQVMTAV
jgi:hypothetical protein